MGRPEKRPVSPGDVGVGLDAHANLAVAAATRDGAGPRLSSGSESSPTRKADRLPREQNQDVIEGQASLMRDSSAVLAVLLLRNGILATGSGDAHGGEIKLWDVASYACLASWRAHANEVRSLAQLESGYLASASADTTVKIWDTSDCSCVDTLQGHSKAVIALATMGNFLVSASADASLRVWSAGAGRPAEEIAVLLGHGSGVRAVTGVRPGVVASGASDTCIKLWEIARAICLDTLHGHKAGVISLALVRPELLASGSLDAAIRLWDLSAAAGGSCVGTLHGHSYDVRALAVHPCGALVSASGDSTIRVWDVRTRQCVESHRGHIADVFGLAMLANGRVASCSSDRTIRVWPLTELQSGDAALMRS
jgi:WD40 repeat protein